MDITPPTMPHQPPPRRWLLIVIGLIIIAIIAIGWFIWWQPRLIPSNQPPTPEQLAAQEITKKSADTERIGNLVAIHLLLTKYQTEHGQYPDQLNQLSDIKGYAPNTAKLIAEAKLENGQNAYSYTKLDKSYELCANQLTGEPKCEGPK